MKADFQLDSLNLIDYVNGFTSKDKSTIFRYEPHDYPELLKLTVNETLKY